MGIFWVPGASKGEPPHWPRGWSGGKSRLRGRQNPSTNFWENLGEGVMWVIDCLLDYNGAVTAIATVFIATFTATIWYVNRRQLKHAREVERAYLSGGGPNRYQDGARHFVLTHENTGKPPAIFKDYSVFLCDRSSLPAEPEYLDPRHTLIPYVARIPPDHKPREITSRAVPNVPNPIAYG